MNIFDWKLVSKKLKNKIKQSFFKTHLKKSVEHGANGTMGYIIKNNKKKA